MITNWVGNAYRKLIGDGYNNFLYRLFQKTGCLLTADGSPHDDKIMSEELPLYQVLPPSLVEPDVVTPIANAIAARTIPLDVDSLDNVLPENDAANEDQLVDNEID